MGSSSAGNGFVLVEGFFDCFAVQVAGLPCVALMGTHLSQKQAEMLAAHFQNVLIALDGDEAGRKGTDNALLTLGSRTASDIEIGTASPPLYVRAIRFPTNAQPDHFKTEELQQLLRVYA